MKNIHIFYLLTCIFAAPLTIKGMDFQDDGYHRQGTQITLAKLCAKNIADIIDKMLKSDNKEAFSLDTTIEKFQTIIPENTPDDVQEMIRINLLDRYANKIFCQPTHKITQYYDGRILSRADRLNNPHSLISSPWYTIKLKELIKNYCIVHNARKSQQPHPSQQMAPMPGIILDIEPIIV